MKRTSQPSENRGVWLSFVLNMALVILLFFSSIFAGLYLSNQSLIERELQSRARAFFKSILVTRRWNATHGGVFVEKAPGVESNPYLENPDIVAVDGKVYTLRNPAMMTREISELAKGKGFFEFHITSLNLVNPANHPDAFEQRALEQFASGAKERFEVVEKDGISVMRYMAPLYVEESCLNCHSKQGYMVGDVRGGISITFNIDEVQKRLRQNRLYTILLFVFSSVLLLVIVYRLISALMRKISVIEAQLRNTAITDALTKIYNRRYLEERLEYEIERAHRYGYRLSCIMFDIDHFKVINDTYGHDSGDKVLVAIAALAHDHCRSSDIVARYGGEEFVMVLPNTSEEAAYLVAEKLRATIEANRVAITDEVTIGATASFGVAELRPVTEGEEFPIRTLISTADAALYQAKSSGRNRVVVHREENQ